MKYLGKSFSSPANSAEYVKNWDAVFGDDDLTELGEPAYSNSGPRCNCRCAYECNWSGCGEKRCMDCDEPVQVDEVKTAVRWCPEHRERGRLGMG
jgi:hypothetical protein